MARRPRRLYKPNNQRQAAFLMKTYQNGKAWGRYHFAMDELPGMLISVPPVDQFTRPREIAHWEAFGRGLLDGYLDAAEKAGLTTSVAQPESEQAP